MAVTKYIQTMTSMKPIDMSTSGDPYVVEGAGNTFTIQTFGNGNVVVYGSLFPVASNIWTTVVTLTSTASVADSAVFSGNWSNIKVVADDGVQFRILKNN